jgi:hypothetical protein
MKRQAYVQGGLVKWVSRVLLRRAFIPILLALWLILFVLGKNSTIFSNDTRKWELGKQSLYDRRHSAGFAEANHLIVVACHAVVKIEALHHLLSDSSWYLLPYQKDQGLPAIVQSHIHKGTQLTHHDPHSILIFSGGQTRRDVGPTSEAASYYYVGEHLGYNHGLHDRIYLEEFARDSFENLLFSICRFKEVRGIYPTSITVIGFDFKEQRFRDLHRHAIGFPLDHFTYIGLKPMPPFLYDKAVEGEAAAVEAFRGDLYGCNTPSLEVKREARNPFTRTVPYELSNSAIIGLLKHCGPQLYDGYLPWSNTSVNGQTFLRGSAN